MDILCIHICKKPAFVCNLCDSSRVEFFIRISLIYAFLAVCNSFEITRLLRAGAVLRAELSNKQKAQMFDTGSTDGTGSRTYWLCQELRQGKALQKREKRNVIIMTRT